MNDGAGGGGSASLVSPVRLLPTLALFVVSLGYGVVVPLLPQLSGGTAQVTPGLISAVYASYAAAKIAAQVPGGVWADRFGGARVLKLAMALFTLSLAGFLVPGGVAWFTAVRALEGAATGLVYPAVFALVLQGGEANSGKRIGLTVGLGTSGLLLGPVLGGSLSPVALRLPVLIALGAAATITACTLLVPAAPARPSTRTVGAEVRHIASLALNLGFIGLLLPIAFNKLTFSAFQGLIPLVSEEWSLSVRAVTGLFALTGVVFGLFQAVGGVLADKLPPRAVVLAFTPVLLVAVGCLALPSLSAWGFTGHYALYIACSSVIFTATLKHAARAFGTDDTYGGLFGVLSTLTDLMTIVGPLLFLGLFGATDRTTLFATMAAIGVASALGYGLLGGRFRRPAT